MKKSVLDNNKKDVFFSPTRGFLSFDGVIYDLVDYMESDREAKYRLVVGTDSKTTENRSSFVSVIVIHRIGHGARYFWQRAYERRKFGLRERIYHEASLSLALAENLIERLNNALRNERANYDFEIHVDIGKGGPTREMIREIVGMIAGNGFRVKTKPEAYGASVVADKHT